MADAVHEHLLHLLRRGRRSSRSAITADVVVCIVVHTVVADTIAAIPLTIEDTNVAGVVLCAAVYHLVAALALFV